MTTKKISPLSLDLGDRFLNIEFREQYILCRGSNGDDYLLINLETGNRWSSGAPTMIAAFSGLEKEFEYIVKR